MSASGHPVACWEKMSANDRHLQTFVSWTLTDFAVEKLRCKERLARWKTARCGSNLVKCHFHRNGGHRGILGHFMSMFEYKWVDRIN